MRPRFGAHYRARDGLDDQVSFDDGKTWKAADRAPGGAGFCRYVTFSDVPVGTRRALVRFAGASRNATNILGFRIDADDREPFGGFRPVKITCRWEEDGRPREQVLVARRPQAKFSIACPSAPVMKSSVLERAE